MESVMIRGMSSFARTTLENKYAQDKPGGSRESWEEVARRVVRSVMAPYLPELMDKVEKLVSQRKFMPGGRYLYAAGRKFPQVNNCLSGDTHVITRTGVKKLRDLVGMQFEVRNRFGRWEKATAKLFGTQRLFRVKFSNGDEVLATANHRWWLSDGTRLTTAEITRVPFTPPTNTNLDEEGIRHGICYGDATTQSQIKTDRLVFCSSNKRELVRYFDSGSELSAGLTVTHLPRAYKSLPDPVNCTPEYARGFVAGLIATDGSTKTSSVTIAVSGRENAETVRQLAVLGGCVVNKVSIQNRAGHETNFGTRSNDLCIVSIKPVSAPLIRRDQIQELGSRKPRLKQMWLGVESIEDTGQTEEVYCCVVPGSESFTLGNGLITSNCFLFRARDSREGWSETLYKCCNSLMTGGGIGVVYSDVRPEDSYITGLGGRSTGPLALMKMNNETGRYVRQGGSRRSAIWAGLHWNHPDVFRFMEMKRWDEVTLLGKSRDFNFPAPMDGTNISVILDSDFFAAYADPEWKATYRTWGSSYSVDHNWAHDVYWGVVRGMLQDGEPGFSVDVGDNEGENLRNACTEVTSRDDSDMCNLGSLNLAAFRTREEFAEGVELGTAFLMCGTLYSKLPIEEMYRVREKNRRLGLGLMGVHEWLLKRGKSYGPDPELGEWMEAYALSGGYSHRYADRLSVSRPVATRAVAPTGTISIIAETTSGLEPIYATAFKRRYLDGQTWKAQYVIDAAAARLVEEGVDPALIEDSMTLADDVGRRMKFQAWVQSYVDHGISSTINLPPWGSDLNNPARVTEFGRLLLKYLPELRGITAYPDGSRGGQPLTRVPYEEARSQLGVEFVDQSEASCKDGVCGT